MREDEDTSKKGTIFLITISYFLSFLFIRLAVIIAGSAGSAASMAAKEGEVSFYIGTNVILFGYHIHHFYFGIALIAIAAWLAIVGSNYFSKTHVALMYGTGLGLFMDEIGLLLTWGDYYSSLSYTLSLFVGGVFLNVVFFPYFWEEVKNNLKKSSPSHWVSKQLWKNKNIFNTANHMSNKIGRTERISLAFTGIIFILIGFIVLIYPWTVYYWVAGGFIIQGISNLVRGWN